MSTKNRQRRADARRAKRFFWTTLTPDRFSDATIVGAPHPVMDAITRLQTDGHAVHAGDIIRIERAGEASRIYHNGVLMVND